tara:strand:+ start:6936 stop:7136 length:201 start_codon:yes stop_codon:yes gene_type:complete
MDMDASKAQAQKLVKKLLKQKYDREGYAARGVHRENGLWKVTITKRNKKVATALVNAKTGDIQLNN